MTCCSWPASTRAGRSTAARSTSARSPATRWPTHASCTRSGRSTADAPAPVVVEGDDGRLRQVVANLVGNALVHTPPDAAVRVRARVDGTDAVLEVSDEGPGMAAEVAQQAFERFYRADPVPVAPPAAARASASRSSTRSSSPTVAGPSCGPRRAKARRCASSSRPRPRSPARHLADVQLAAAPLCERFRAVASQLPGSSVTLAAPRRTQEIPMERSDQAGRSSGRLRRHAHRRRRLRRHAGHAHHQRRPVELQLVDDLDDRRRTPRRAPGSTPARVRAASSERSTSRSQPMRSA